MCKKQFKRAYSFAEILITLVIIAFIALLTTALLPKGKHKKEEKISHGTYACTVFDNEEYVFISGRRNEVVPTEKSKWTKSKCGTGFKMPSTAGILDVRVIGGGGAGGDATATWDKNFLPVTFSGNSTYRIEGAGIYEIAVYGGIGTDSSLSDWSIASGKCFAPIAGHGESILYKSYTTLENGDILSVNFNTGSGAIINTLCGMGPKPLSFSGKNGNDITIKRNNNTIVKVDGSKAGTYACRPSESCSKRFEAQKGSNGYLAHTSTTTISNTINHDTYNKVMVRWSDKNASARFFKKVPGCGGLPGEINSTLYPILRKNLPAISIGKPGTSTTEATETTFGTLSANAGKSNKSCATTSSNKNDGSMGVSFTGLEDFLSAGGSAGVSSPTGYNGGAANGFGAGGGGGAYYSHSEPVYKTFYSEEANNEPVLDGVRRWYVGTGGNGGAGLLIISW